MNALTRRSIRVVTAVLMVVSVAALVAVGVQRSRGLARPAGDRAGSLPEGKPGDPAVGVYTGFEYVETVAGRAIFALRSLRTLGRSSGWHEIEGVQLQLYDAGVARISRGRHERFVIDKTKFDAKLGGKKGVNA